MRLRHAFPGLSRKGLAGVVVASGVAVLVANLMGGSAAIAAATDLVVTGPGQGGGANIRTFGPDGGSGGVSYFSSGTPTSGATVAVGDINGDGEPEIITGTGPGPVAQVQVWSKDGQTKLAEANPFPGFTGGISVGAANVDETAQLEVVVGAGPGGGPHVKTLRFSSGSLVDQFSFYAYDPNFRGGVFVAGTGGRIITGPGAGGGPHVRVFQIASGELSVAAEWMAYGAFTGGVHVAAGFVRSSTVADVITGAGPGGGPHVKLYSLDGDEGPGLMAYDPSFRGGVWVAAGYGQRLITGAGTGGGPHVKVLTFNASDSAFPVAASFMAYSATFTGGVHVGGFPTPPPPPPTTTTEECVGIPPICLPGGGGEETTTTTSGGGTTTSTTSPNGGTTTTSTSTTSTSSTTSTTSTSSTTTTSSTTSSSTTSTTAGGGGTTTTSTTPETTTTTEACGPIPPCLPL